MARLKPGITVSQAQEEMNRITRDLEKEYPDTNRGWGVKVTSLKTWQTQAPKVDSVARAVCRDRYPPPDCVS